MGASSVVAETRLSGISELPFVTFILLMLPIHVVIGFVEGGVTAAVTRFVARARPEMLAFSKVGSSAVSFRRVVLSLVAIAFLTGGLLSWFASEHPDGLEWSIQQMTGKTEIDGAGNDIHRTLGALQAKLSFMPDYDFPKDEVTAKTQEGESVVKPSTSLAGILGAVITLLLAGGIGLFLRWRSQKSTHTNE